MTARTWFVLIVVSRPIYELFHFIMLYCSMYIHYGQINRLSLSLSLSVPGLVHTRTITHMIIDKPSPKIRLYTNYNT